MLSKNAINLLTQRYCRNGEEPKDVYKRTAFKLSNNNEVLEELIYNLMCSNTFLPNSPALFNSGYSNMLHACCALGIEDNIQSIADFEYRMTMMFKYGAGVGANYSYLRSKDTKLSSGGSSSGVISLLEVIDKKTDYIKQGGYRRGASIAVLNYNHPEIIEFCQRKLKGGLNNMNLSVMVTDEFMRKVINGETTKLIDPHTKESKLIKAYDLFEIIAFCAWSCGCPGLLFFDRINKDNKLYPEVIIDTVNPCLTKDSLLLDGEYLKRITEKANNYTQWSTGIKQTIKLILNNGLEIKCTPDHLIETENGFVKAIDTIGKNIKYGLGNRNANVIYKDLEICGFVFGDGFRSGKKVSCSIRINEEKENEIYKRLIDYGFKKEKCNDLYIHRNKFNFDNSFLDYNRLNRNIPKYIMESDSNTTVSFLRGLFEANGSCNKRNGQISYKTINKQLAKDIQILLASFGIISWITQNKEQKIVWKNGTYISKPSYNLQIAPRNTLLFFKKIGFISTRKNNNYKKTNGEYKTKLKVIKIIDNGFEEVFDFNMNDKSEKNFCNGLIVHNCAESPIPNDTVCCLGSINISKFVKNNEFDFEKFGYICSIVSEALINMNKIGWYPFDFIKEAMNKYNPYGVGIMGFADTLIKLGIYYDSKETIKFINQIGKIYKESTDSVNPDSFYHRIIAPTGSLSILADCSSSIEPVFSEVFERNLTVGKIEETRPIYKSEYCRTAHEIDPKWHMRIQSAWQTWCDGGISKTINLSHDTSIQDIKNIFIDAWEMNLKGITIYRDMSKSEQVLTKKGCEGDTCYL